MGASCLYQVAPELGVPKASPSLARGCPPLRFCHGALTLIRKRRSIRRVYRMKEVWWPEQAVPGPPVNAWNIRDRFRIKS